MAKFTKLKQFSQYNRDNLWSIKEYTAKNVINSMAGKSNKNKWSQDVTQKSHALDLEEGVFTWEDSRKIARSLKKSADKSDKRKTNAYNSAMSMLNFYMNRAGSKLGNDRKKTLNQAKKELKKMYNRT